jgi:tRNA 2-selenouridine synthase
MQIITVDQALKLPHSLFIDTRSPAEFEQGHIPGAVNVPLLENEERAIVGTLYKQIGPEPAKKKGLEIVSGKLSHMVGQIAELLKESPEATLVVYCWRGGMRSKSLLTILELMGIQGAQLQGGYKMYRHYVQDCLAAISIQPQLYVLCGSTGVGKTTLLQLLADRDYPVVDLEGMANHRGSAFGHVGKGKPTTAQNFDAELLDLLCRINHQPLFFVECESKRVGNVYLPEPLYAAMQTGRKILIQASRRTRAQRLIEEYTNALVPNNPEIINSIASLGKKLGKKKIAQFLSDYEAGNLLTLTETLLEEYYDPLYGYETASSELFDLITDGEDLFQAADQIAIHVERLKRGK